MFDVRRRFSVRSHVAKVQSKIKPGLAKLLVLLKEKQSLKVKDYIFFLPIPSLILTTFVSTAANMGSGIFYVLF